jgi:hypothetical protein
MIDNLRLSWLAAFIATGITVITFLLLLILCAVTVTGPEQHLGDRMPLVYIVGTLAGLALAYARYEYRNLSEARAEAS